MNELKWNDWFNIGVDCIDKAHQRLFSIVSKLLSLNEDTAKQQHACREGIKYFKNYALKHFVLNETYQLEKIDVMTFDQLTKAFDKQYPSCSLLFNTKNNGYFAFCVKQGK